MISPLTAARQKRGFMRLANMLTKPAVIEAKSSKIIVYGFIDKCRNILRGRLASMHQVRKGVWIPCDCIALLCS